jgi:cyclopropane fatty-acyl-phospholipid synthase-like methyltransferase
MGRVLDAGPGESLFPLLVAQQGYDVDTLDIRENYPESHPNLHDHFSSDLTQVSGLPDRTYNGIVCISVLEHIGANENEPANALLAIENLCRLLTEGGRLILTTTYSDRARRRREGTIDFDAERIDAVKSTVEAADCTVLHEQYFIDDVDENERERRGWFTDRVDSAWRSCSANDIDAGEFNLSRPFGNVALVVEKEE